MTIGPYLKRLGNNFRSVVIAEHQFRLTRRLLLIVSDHSIGFRDRCLNFDFVDTHNAPLDAESVRPEW